MPVVWLLPGGRKPIWIGMRPTGRDGQADVPVNWCVRCGREVFHPGSCLCYVCAKRKEKEDELDG